MQAKLASGADLRVRRPLAGGEAASQVLLHPGTRVPALPWWSCWPHAEIIADVGHALPGSYRVFARAFAEPVPAATAPALVSADHPATLAAGKVIAHIAKLAKLASID